MTATPIPRTLAMTIYSDLDVSLLDELPPGRKPVRTHIVNEAARKLLYDRVKEHLARGRQAYIVYPLVEASEKEDLRDATTMCTALRETVFTGGGTRVGLLHGRMKADEKEAVMRRFRDGDLHVLVTTTVVEVGVDVPNATVMVDRARRALRPLAAAPAARPGGARQRRRHLPAGRTLRRRSRVRHLSAAEGDGDDHRRLQDRRGRPRAARARRLPRHPPARPARLPRRQPDPRHPHPGRGARGGGEVADAGSAPARRPSRHRCARCWSIAGRAVGLAEIG